MATNFTNDTMQVALEQEATLTASETNVGALLNEWRLEAGHEGWEEYLAWARGLCAFFGVPAAQWATAADALNLAWGLQTL